ncbi:hypothetical protein PQX77_019822 [Marasmius sp. AFHP31]|nr:hypothetical protein PQX77_019822 [Marasmius sp. AFHP31]
MTKEECVKETRRWLALMGRLLKQEAKLKSKEFAAISCLKKREGTRKEFGLDGLSLENAFVDEQDPTNIKSDVSAPTSTTNGTKSQSSDPLPSDFGTLAHEWFHYETAGMRLRMAHRFVEWDGWEEGLVESMLGSEEFEEDWFKRTEHNAESAL